VLAKGGDVPIIIAKMQEIVPEYSQLVPPQ